MRFKRDKQKAEESRERKWQLKEKTICWENGMRRILDKERDGE